MAMTKAMPPPLKSEQGRFILTLNKAVYRDDILKKALLEDADWIAEIPVSDDYFCVQLKTSHITDVFQWMNYLIYLHKA